MKNKIYNLLESHLKFRYNIKSGNTSQVDLSFLEKKFGVYIFSVDINLSNYGYLLVYPLHVEFTRNVDYTSLIIRRSAKTCRGTSIDTFDELFELILKNIS
jgi:hypothetical protein